MKPPYLMGKTMGQTNTVKTGDFGVGYWSDRKVENKGSEPIVHKYYGCYENFPNFYIHLYTTTF